MGDPTDSPAAIRIDMGEEAAGSPEGAAAFLSSLPAPLDGYGRDALPAEGGGVPPGRRRGPDRRPRGICPDAAAGAGVRPARGPGTMVEAPQMPGGGGGGRLLEYLRAAMALCVHLVSAAERLDAIDRADGEGGGGTDALPGCYRGMGSPAARKLPFLLLEDTVDSLPPRAAPGPVDGGGFLIAACPCWWSTSAPPHPSPRRPGSCCSRPAISFCASCPTVTGTRPSRGRS